MERPNKLDTYLYMIKKEVTRNSYVDLIENWDITEEEADDCEQFISDSINSNFMFAKPEVYHYEK